MITPDSGAQKAPSPLKMFTSPIVTLKSVRESETGLGFVTGLLVFEWFLLEPHQLIEHSYRLFDSPLSGALMAWSGFVRFALGPAVMMLAGGMCLYYIGRHRGEPSPKLWGGICSFGYAWTFHTFLVAAISALALFGVEEPFSWLNQSYAFEPLLGLTLEGLPALLPMLIAFGPSTKVTHEAPSQPSAPRLKVGAVALVVLLATLATAQHVQKIQGSAKPLLSEDILPHFNLNALGGGPPLHSKDLLGKVSLIDVWATWCGPCVATMPYVDDLYTKYQGTDFQLVSMNVEPHNLAAVQSFVRNKDLSFPVYVDTGRAQEALKIRVFPTMILVDRQGVVRKVHVGVTSIAGLENELIELLENP